MRLGFRSGTFFPIENIQVGHDLHGNDSLSSLLRWINLLSLIRGSIEELWHTRKEIEMKIMTG